MKTLKLGQNLKDILTNINANFTELVNRSNVKYKVLYSGSASVPSNSSGSTNTITLSDDLSNYDGVIIQREDCGAWQYFGDLSVGTILKPVNSQADFTLMMEGLNLFECNCEVLSNKQLNLSNNVYSGITTAKTARYIPSFEDTPVTKIIGIKLN